MSQPKVRSTARSLRSPGEPAQDFGEQDLRVVPLGDAGGGGGRAHEQAQRVHQQMPLAPVDLFGGVAANRAAVRVGLDALAVEQGRWD